ncbi:SDR family NAD(P)-dependent oxidoreductase [Micromonospora sp. CA-246542]|uniref:SDR family NAD(P)-dependent oxidoreductase n=1 Tax=Micromonospora sp. CA-246542 TaxID=3239959 RepID=UPI003D91CBFE
MQLAQSDVVEFARASGDHNPLHADESFARCTSFGRTIVHGALVTVAALAALPPERLRLMVGLTVSFIQPVFPGAPFTVEREPDDRLTISAQGSRLVKITPHFEEGGTPPAQPFGQSEHLDQHPLDEGRLRRLAERLGAAAVPMPLLSGMAWVSWLVGMRNPGRDALLAGFTVRTARDAAAVPWARVDAADERTGALTLVGGNPAVTAIVRAFRRQPVPEPTPASLAEFLSPSDSLTGRHVMVVGASRGWGAAMAAALASQQATVFALYAHSQDRVARLAERFPGVIPLRADATDQDALLAVRDRIRQVCPTLDGLVLSAAPPLRSIAPHPDAADDQLAFVQTSLNLAVRPLLALDALLTAQSWTLVASSTAVAAPRRNWAHYVAAKSGIEGYVRAWAGQRDVRTVLVRAPKLLTDMMNSPLGRIGAMPAEQAAAAAVQAVLKPASSLVTVLDDL